MSAAYYMYRHYAGYGRDDHMAGELIARACRVLGVGTDRYIAQAVGLASHAVPMESVEVRIASAPGVRARMERALRAARREYLSRVDTYVGVECQRRVRVGNGYAVEVRRGRRWIFNHLLDPVAEGNRGIGE